MVADGVRSCVAANMPTVVLFFTYSNGYTWVDTIKVFANDGVTGNILFVNDPTNQSRVLPTEILIDYTPAEPGNPDSNSCGTAPAGSW